MTPKQSARRLTAVQMLQSLAAQERANARKALEAAAWLEAQAERELASDKARMVRK